MLDLPWSKNMLLLAQEAFASSIRYGEGTWKAFERRSEEPLWIRHALQKRNSKGLGWLGTPDEAVRLSFGSWLIPAELRLVESQSEAIHHSSASTPLWGGVRAFGGLPETLGKLGASSPEPPNLEASAGGSLASAKAALAAFNEDRPHEEEMAADAAADDAGFSTSPQALALLGSAECERGLRHSGMGHLGRALSADLGAGWPSTVDKESNAPTETAERASEFGACSLQYIDDVARATKEVLLSVLEHEPRSSEEALASLRMLGLRLRTLADDVNAAATKAEGLAAHADASGRAHDGHGRALPSKSEL
jgi:hypothetical protein